MPPKIEAATKATFETDDKRAQYARLAVFNHGQQHKIIPKDVDPNSVKEADLQKAFKDLAGGNLLEGKDGIAMIQKLTKAHATDPKVAERGLTTAYAQEVRPFLKKGLLSPNFGRRGGLTEEQRAEREAQREQKAKERYQERLEAAAKRNKINLSDVTASDSKTGVTLADVNAYGKKVRDEAKAAEKAEKERLAAEAKAKAEAEEAAAAA